MFNNGQNVVKERPLMQCILNDTIESSKVEMFLCKLKSSFSVSWEIGKSAPGDLARLALHRFMVSFLVHFKKLSQVQIKILYARHYNPRFLYFKSHFLKVKNVFSRSFFQKILSLCIVSIQERFEI